MKVPDMRKKTPAELHKHVTTLRDNLAKASIERHTKGVNNAKEMQVTRKEIAKALTVAKQLSTEAESKDK